MAVLSVLTLALQRKSSFCSTSNRNAQKPLTKIDENGQLLMEITLKLYTQLIISNNVPEMILKWIHA